jgi:ribonuclease HII
VTVLGIDEAGRGCVLGDLVVAGFLYEGDPEILVQAGAADSKTLTPARRLEVRERLRTLGRPVLRRITPKQIDGENLNRLEEAAIASLVRELAPERVIVDALGHPSTLGAVGARLRAAVAPLGCAWRIVPKADRDHPEVGAASIFAKTARDEALQALCASWGALGSGYPSDPATRSWLEAHARSGAPWPPFVRTRWGTVQALAQRGLIGSIPAP